MGLNRPESAFANSARRHRQARLELENEIMIRALKEIRKIGADNPQDSELQWVQFLAEKAIEEVQGRGEIQQEE